MMPPMYHRPMSDSPAYVPSWWNSGSPPFHSDECTCMPDPLSSKSGFGMNVAVSPACVATLLTMYL